MVDAQVPSGLYYTREHYWVRIEYAHALVGLTDHAQNELGDVVLVKLPEVGAEYHASDEIGEIESVKTPTELYAPISGRVIEVNGALEGAPGLVNEDPYGDGWLVSLELSDLSEIEDLLGADDYGHLVQEGE